MKKFIILLIGGSLTLAAAAIAQPPEDQQNQHTKKSKHNQTEQAQTAAPTNQAQPPKQHGHGMKAGGQENNGPNANATSNNDANASYNAGRHGRKNRKGKPATSTADTNVNQSAQTSSNTATGENVTGKGKGRHGRNAKNKGEESSITSGTAASTSGATTTHSNTNVAPNTGNTNANTNVNARTNVNTAATGQPRGHGKGGKELNQQTVQQVKSEHANFKAQPRPDVAPAVTFNEHHRIEHAQEWQGPQYSVYRSYHPEWHDRSWYHSHYSRVELIGGGYYYFNNGYWYPAWGYNPGEQYYAYDGPIYVGHSAEPPDKVIADVQGILKDAGYYTGEVDGLLGPLTRQALIDYQRDNGLYATAVIDEPTLDSLGLT